MLVTGTLVPVVFTHFDVPASPSRIAPFRSRWKSDGGGAREGGALVSGVRSGASGVVRKGRLPVRLEHRNIAARDAPVSQ